MLLFWIRWAYLDNASNWSCVLRMSTEWDKESMSEIERESESGAHQMQCVIMV